MSFSLKKKTPFQVMARSFRLCKDYSRHSGDCATRVRCSRNIAVPRRSTRSGRTRRRRCSCIFARSSHFTRAWFMTAVLHTHLALSVLHGLRGHAPGWSTHARMHALSTVVRCAWHVCACRSACFTCRACPPSVASTDNSHSCSATRKRQPRCMTSLWRRSAALLTLPRSLCGAGSSSRGHQRRQLQQVQQ